SCLIPWCVRPAAATSSTCSGASPQLQQPRPSLPHHRPRAESNRIFASYCCTRPHAGAPYTAHDITKGHPSLAGTPPGHAHSPALSQSPYNPGQNAGSAPLVYSPQTQPINAQPQSRPFFQRTQMQTARPTIPTNTPSIRPGSQTPTAAVYPTNQPIMMTMAPMPFPSPQAAQYYIPQYRHSTPYVGPPQQYSVQPPGSGTFYPGPGPGEYPAPYPGPPYYPGQYPPSTPIIVPTPQQPPPAKREKKTIRIRDPNQGGKDITEEIMAGGSGSRNSTPPVGPPSSTPTPPQVWLSHAYTHPSLTCSYSTYNDMPKLEPVAQKSSSPGLVQPEAPVERLKANAPVTEPTSAIEPGLPFPASLTTPATLPLTAANTSERPSVRESTASASSSYSSTAGEQKPSPAPPQTPNTDKPLSDAPRTLAASPAPAPKALNGLAESGTELDTAAHEPSLMPPAALQPQASAPAYREASSSETLPSDVRPEVPIAAALAPMAPVAVVPVTLTSSPAPALPVMLPPGLPPLVQATTEADEPSKSLDTKDLVPRVGAEAHGGITDSKTEPQHQALIRKSPTTGIVSVAFHGKRQYDRDFLLGFQFMPACIQKPEGLPPISDVVLDKMNQNKLPSRVVDSRVISRGPDFTPAFADFGRQMTGGRGAALMNIGARRPPPRKIIMNVSVNDDIQLKKSENAWKPGMKREGLAEDPETQRTQELFRKVRSILNKLTPQKFNQLMKQVTDLTIDTEERLKGVIDLVFEKAIDEPSFSVAYGNMCRCLATLKVPMTDKPNTTVNFRKLLLNRCQKEFEKDKVDDVVFERKQKELDSAASATERERLQEELEEAKDKARRRSIGNIKFIGELFKLKMLTEAIMHDCVVKLLKNHDEESLECLCRLLTTIGKDLDFEKAKPRMDQYFNQMEKIVKERKTSSRIRFMLQDVIDLRLHNWVSRRADQGPKTIEQIHKEAKIEEQEEQRKVHQQLLSKDSKRRPGQRDETWNTVPMTKNSRTIDPTKIPKISKPQMDEKIQLGPRAQVTWVKGSSGGAKASDSGEMTQRAEASLCEKDLETQHRSEKKEKTLFITRPSFFHLAEKRSEKPLISAPPSSRPGPFIRGSSSKELLESQTPEELRRDREREGAEPRRPSVTEDKTEPERSRVREPAKPEPVVQTLDRPALSEEEIERKSKSIIDEFLHINDYKEAVQCVDELDLGSQLHIFVRVGVESTLERSQITRDHMGQLLFQLVQQGILPKPQFYKGFADTLEQADDMAIDIPHIWLYLAELLSPVLREGGFSMRELFSELSKPLLPVGRAGILISEILHILCKQMSHRTVASLWRESGLNWTDFLPEGEDVQTFISQQKLQFVLSDGSGPEAALSKRILSPEELRRQLERLLLEDMASDEQIFDWVEANLDESQMSSSPFLRALMTAVLCTYSASLRLPVLLKYLNSDTERQLQALYALQALIVALDQPPNLLRMFFDCLYDEDVISEDAFYKWETSKDPAEQQGKGVALKSVTAFFTWLREAEEESEDN
uniref:Eukaryotic translation initiation factor 4 gamma 3 n=1 Tax=Lates calcarifer TaxID=8187 RepID=A0A4W6DBS3_LATCA